MVRRTKSGKILVRIGPDARKRAARNAKVEKEQSDRAAKKTAKKAATRLKRSQREIAKRATMLARRLARNRARDARREAKRRERDARRRDRDNRDNGDDSKPKRKRPFHPRGSNATAKYTSYGRRAERAKKLKGNRVSPTICIVGSYTVKYSGDKAISCTCDDFTQGTWKGSAAGPFNPCKHMMAECKGKKWKCLNGVCTQDLTGLYNSEAECQAALVPAGFTGGQSRGVIYVISIELNWRIDNEPWVYQAPFGQGAILGEIVEIRDEITFNANGLRNGRRIDAYNYLGQTHNIWGVGSGGVIQFDIINLSVYRQDGQPDTGGDPPPKCP